MDANSKFVPASVDIAVVGVACRFPGGASNTTKFWEILSESRCMLTILLLGTYKIDAYPVSCILRGAS
jgi:acyl transferase domain-containing protein